jgi:hypothetical protein
LCVCVCCFVHGDFLHHVSFFFAIIVLLGFDLNS